MSIQHVCLFHKDKIFNQTKLQVYSILEQLILDEGYRYVLGTSLDKYANLYKVVISYNLIFHV